MVRFHPRLPTLGSQTLDVCRRSPSRSLTAPPSRCRAARPSATSPRRYRLASRRARTPGWSTTAWSTSPIALREDGKVRVLTVEGSRGADGLQTQHGAPAGRCRHAALSQRAVRHRPADRRRLLLRLRGREAVRAGGSRAHRGADARARLGRSRLRAADLAARRGDRPSSPNAASR